ncbi:spore coat protein [Alkalibacillus almallahensis]|uniref:spore coat protein n=1 Tax=Alkalibacillus almallahensis TaxID=1379154 RepID=UPI0014222C53|nr:spore coat protein [Alkalibacillus almallahensis]NIK11356.1 spore coat protein CotF [Alkalibacillus almallahensis]
MDQQQNPNSQMKESETLPTHMSNGGHAIYDAHEAISTVIGAMEHYKMYEQNIQCQQLQGILSNQYDYLTQTYNTMVDAYSSGQKPAQPTAVYNMEISNDVTYGLQPSQPKQPEQNPQQLNDECYSGFMLGQLKACATAANNAALEATNPVMRRVLQDSVPNFSEMAYEMFLYQNDKGYYQVAQFDQDTTNQLLNSYAPMTNSGQTH